ncbi:hypothetical protein [Dyadobacter bucti]|uniref:hypothetical protein n=1 Tax=Dyadobacter bucti TaxID=2572203 RepID=UPI003F70C18B
MSTFEYPEVGTYKLPKKNVLVISCIDLRLTDNLLNFLHYDNLTNRYDHFALAGTSLCTCVEEKREYFEQAYLKKFEDFKHWEKSLFDHINLAVTLHDIRDVYIVEHADCGAYQTFLTKEKLTQGEMECHREFAANLAYKIRVKQYPEDNPEHNQEKEDKKFRLNVHNFFIDLRGNVKLLDTFPPLNS